MQQHLAHGTESLPKLMLMDILSEQVYFDCEPRPKPMQDLLAVYKSDLEKDKAEFYRALQVWYNSDASHTLEAEILRHLKTI